MVYRTFTGFKKVIRLAGKTNLSDEEEKAAKELCEYLHDAEVWFVADGKEKWQAMLEYFAILDIDPNSGMVFWQRKERRERKHVKYCDNMGTFTETKDHKVTYFPFVLQQPLKREKVPGSSHDEQSDDEENDSSSDDSYVDGVETIEQYGCVPLKTYQEAVEKVPFVITVFDPWAK